MTSSPALHLTLVPWEDGVDLDIRMTLPVTAAEVWAQLADPAACGAWFAPYTRDGDTLTFDAGEGETFTAEIIHCVEESDVMIDFADFGPTGLSLRPVDGGAGEYVDAATEIIVTRPHADHSAVADSLDSRIEGLWPSHLELLAEHLGHRLASQGDSTFLDETFAALSRAARAAAAEDSR